MRIPCILVLLAGPALVGCGSDTPPKPVSNVGRPCQVTADCGEKDVECVGGTCLLNAAARTLEQVPRARQVYDEVNAAQQHIEDNRDQALQRQMQQR